MIVFYVSIGNHVGYSTLFPETEDLKSSAIDGGLFLKSSIFSPKTIEGRKGENGGKKYGKRERTRFMGLVP